MFKCEDIAPKTKKNGDEKNDGNDDDRNASTIASC
jgi:hypothetical protein